LTDISIKIEIPEFERTLDLDEFLDSLDIIESAFDYKDIPEEKKVKLVILRLRKYSSL